MDLLERMDCRIALESNIIREKRSEKERIKDWINWYEHKTGNKYVDNGDKNLMSQEELDLWKIALDRHHHLVENQTHNPYAIARHKNCIRRLFKIITGAEYLD